MAIGLALAGILLFIGLTLLFDAAIAARQREPLARRLARHQAVVLADEAEQWLRRR